jgi:hypothetical protein
VDYTVIYFLPIPSIVASYQSEIWVAQRLSRTAPCRVLYSSTCIFFLRLHRVIVVPIWDPGYSDKTLDISIKSDNGSTFFWIATPSYLTCLPYTNWYLSKVYDKSAIMLEILPFIETNCGNYFSIWDPVKDYIEGSGTAIWYFLHGHILWMTLAIFLSAGPGQP